MTSFSELAQSRSNNLMNETKKHFNTDYLNKTTKEDRIKAFYKAKGEIQDEDSYLKEIKTKEIESLTSELGVDYNLEYEKYGFFIEMAVNSPLPLGWSKELKTNNELIYFNINDGNHSYSHPCLPTIKRLMKTEFKRMARSFDLNRAFGKGDSYMEESLKFFTGKILSNLTIYQIGRYFTHGEKEDEFDKQENLNRRMEATFSNIYGLDLKIIRDKVKNMRPMRLVDHFDLTRVLKYLRIMETHPELVWIGRLYLSLPIPEEWILHEESQTSNVEAYKHINTSEILFVRPCYFYIIRILEIAKNNKPMAEGIAKMWIVNKEHIFEDGFGRIFSLGNKELFHLGEDDGDDEDFKINKAKFLISNLIRKRKEKIFRKKKVEELTDPFIEKVDGYLRDTNLSDDHILQICKQLNIDYNDISQCHILYFIFNFVAEKVKKSQWIFRNPSNGDCYWINHAYKRISSTYPYIEELSIKVKEFNEKMLFQSSQAYAPENFKNLSKLKRILSLKTESEIINLLESQRSRFTAKYNEVKLQYYVELYTSLKSKLQRKIEKYHKRQKFVLDNENPEELYTTPKLTQFIKQTFDASDFAEKLVIQMSKEQIKDLLFYNFFNLDKFRRTESGYSLLKLKSSNVLTEIDKIHKEQTGVEQSNAILDKIMEDVKDLEDINRNDIDDIVAHAKKLIKKATNLQEINDLDLFLESELLKITDDRTDIFLKHRLDIYKKYGDLEQTVSDNIINQKWKKIQTIAKIRKKLSILESTIKRKNEKKQKRSVFLKRFKDTNPRRRGSNITEHSSSGSRNRRRSLMSKVNEITSEIGGELVDQINSLDPIDTPLPESITNKIKKMNTFTSNRRRSTRGESRFVNERNSDNVIRSKNSSRRRNSSASEYSEHEMKRSNERKLNRNIPSIENLILRADQSNSHQSSNPKPNIMGDSSGVSIQQHSSKKILRVGGENRLGSKISDHNTNRRKSQFGMQTLELNRESMRSYSDIITDSSDIDGLEIDIELKDLGFEEDQVKRVNELKKKVNIGLGFDLMKKTSGNPYLRFKQEKHAKRSALLEKLIITALEGNPKSSRSQRELEYKKTRTVQPTENQLRGRDVPGQGAGGLLFQFFQRLAENSSVIKGKVEEAASIKIINPNYSKLYQFGSGECINIRKDKVLEALNEFDRLYEHIIENDLFEREKNGEFDYETLLTLLQTYLSKVLTEFRGFTNKDQDSITKILERTKQAYFSYKLKKKYLHSVVKYEKIDIFVRLNEYEIFSLRRLFRSLKGFMLRFSSVFKAERPCSQKRLKLGLPEPNSIEFKEHLKDNQIQLSKALGNCNSEANFINRQIERLFESLPKLDQSSKERQPNFKMMADIKKIVRQEELESLSTFEIEDLESVIERIVARALFELIDFSKLETVDYTRNPILPQRLKGYKLMEKLENYKKKGHYTVYEYNPDIIRNKYNMKRNDTGIIKTTNMSFDIKQDTTRKCKNLSNKNNLKSLLQKAHFVNKILPGKELLDQKKDHFLKDGKLRDFRAHAQANRKLIEKYTGRSAFLIMPPTNKPLRSHRITSKKINRSETDVRSSRSGLQAESDIRVKSRRIIDPKRNDKKQDQQNEDPALEQNIVIKGSALKEGDTMLIDAFLAFREFRKRNYSLIQHSKLAIFEVITPELMIKLSTMDPSSVDELKNKVMNRLTRYIKNEIYLHNDLNLLRPSGQFTMRSDSLNITDKIRLGNQLRYNISDLTIQTKNII